MGSFFAPLTVMRRNSGFLVPKTTEVCTYNASFGSKDWKLLGVTPGRRPLRAFDSCSSQKACSYIFSPSFVFSLPPSLSPFALDLSIQLVFTVEDSLRSQGWKRISLCEDLFAYCSSFHDCLWSDERLCLRGLCLCIRNFRWLWDHDSDSWVLHSRVLGPQARKHFYKQHLYGNRFLCFQIVQLIWHSIWNYLKSLNFWSFCFYLQGLGSQVCDAVLGLCGTENLT